MPAYEPSEPSETVPGKKGGESEDPFPGGLPEIVVQPPPEEDEGEDFPSPRP
jgi:hypothetical protein